MFTVPPTACFNKPNVVCARKDGGYTCGGDSGGPAVVDRNNDGIWVQYGLVSFGNGGCGVKDHTGFTDVSVWADQLISIVSANQ